MMRRPDVHVLILCAMLVLAGCGGPAPAPDGDTAPPESSVAGNQPEPAPGGETPPATADEGTPVDGDWVIIRLPVEPQHLNTLLDTADAYCARISMDIFDSLLDMDKDTFELKPMLAERYEVSEDHLMYTFFMRKDAKFSDGTPVTAKDVKFTFDAIQNTKNETADLRNYFQDVTAVDLLDDYTIRFTCNKPYFRHLVMLSGMPVYPMHVYSQGDFNTGAFNRKPMGSGPYVFDSWETNQQIVLTRNDSAWNPSTKGHPSKLVYKIITDDNAAFQVLERQELDVMGLTQEQWENRASTPQFEAKFNKHKYWGRTGYAASYGYIGWNMRKPQFADKRVRQALTMLLDREEILETVLFGLGKQVSGPSDLNSREYDNSIAPWPFDPEKAKTLLDEAGWIDHDSDGTRDKDGMPFSFEFMLPPGNVEMQTMATVFQEELKRAGINMRIRNIEWAAFIETITKREFDAVTLLWAIPPDSEPYQIWHSSQAEKGSNYPGYKNPEVDKLLEDIRVEFDREKRIPMFHRIHAILHDEQPYTFLWSTYALAAVDKRFQGVKVHRLGLDSKEWWVPLAEQRYSEQ
ncbi:MAG: peptide-binding protein [Candidatus Hydrogenedentes bacterium]|nr:peptide-binding protein [Candidatus Hydrogenedentota bacterium]